MRMALRSHRRVIAPDIATCGFMVDSEDQKLFLEAGIHASQSTPLMARRGKFVGMISTHWRTPHQPTEEDFRLFDVLARQAADLIQREARKQEHS
jgi:GAF domain-containing protein